MSDPENRASVPFHMTSNECGPAYVISAVSPGIAVSITLVPHQWPPAALADLLETIAAGVRANGSQPKDTDRMTWAEKPRGDA